MRNTLLPCGRCREVSWRRLGTLGRFAGTDLGYSANMFKHPIRTIIRKLPLSAWAMLGWTQRHSVGLWWRSIVAEAKRDEPLSLKRWATLFKALVKVSGDHRLANARALKQLTVDGSAVVATATQNWSERGTLTTVLEGVSEASDVRISSSSPVDRPWSATGPA